METLIGFVAAALALTGSPGPNTLSLAAVGAAFGRTRGLGYMLGLNLGMVLVIVIVGSGVSGLLLAMPTVTPVVIAIAAAYFVYLAYRIASAPPLNTGAETGQAPRWFEGVALSLLNPKAYAVMAALFSGFTLLAGDPVLDGLSKAVVTVLTIVAVNMAWLLVGAALTPLLKEERTSRIINIGFAILLILSVLATMLL